MTVGVPKFWVVRAFFRAKAYHSGTNGDDACGCRCPLGGVVVITFRVSELRVKTFDCDLDNGAVRRRYPLGGIVMEFWFCSVLI